MYDDLISVIVPVYNTEKYLDKCINSIIKQTHKSFELILVDDGSTDKSAVICNEFAKKDERIIVIHKKNAGQALARNDALNIAKGKYVAFVDSDDYIAHTMLEKLLDTIKENNADMAVCGVMNDHYFLKKECPKMNRARIFNTDELFISYLTEPYIRSILCNKLFKAELWENVRFPSIRAREDEFVLYEIYGKCKKTSYINQSLYFQLIRPGSTEQSDFSEDKMISIEWSKRLVAYICKNHFSLKPYTELLVANTYCQIMRQMASSRNFKNNIDSYNHFVEKLGLELEKNKIHSKINERLYNELIDIVNNQRVFLKCCKRIYIKNKIVNTIKRIVIPFYR